MATKKTELDVGQRRPWVSITFPPVPDIPTTTILAVGFLAGNLLFLPTIALLGRFILVDFREAVMTVAGLFKDGMLLILGYYFAKVVNASQDRLVDKAMEAAKQGEVK